MNLIKFFIVCSLVVPNLTLARANKSHGVQFIAQFEKEVGDKTSAADFIRYVLAGYTEAEIEYALDLAKKAHYDNAPKMKFDGNSVAFQYDDRSLTVTVVDPFNNKFSVDGYNFQKQFGNNLKEDLAYVERILNRNSNASLYRAIIPEAHAFLPLVAYYAIAVAGVGTLAINYAWAAMTKDETSLKLKEQIKAQNLIAFKLNCVDLESLSFETQSVVARTNANDFPCTISSQNVTVNTIPGSTLQKCKNFETVRGLELADIEDKKSKPSVLSQSELRKSIELTRAACHCCSKDDCAKKINADKELQPLKDSTKLSCTNQSTQGGSTQTK